MKRVRQDVILFHFLRGRATFLNLTLFRDKWRERERERPWLIARYHKMRSRYAAFGTPKGAGSLPLSLTV